MTNERSIGSRRIYQGRVISLRVDNVLLPNGHTVEREIVEHGEAVVIVAVDSQKRVLLVRQYRLPAGQVLLELPAGSVEHGEDIVEGARRELQEETGYAAKKMERIGGFYSAPGFTTEFLHLFLATGLRRKPLTPDDDEQIELVRTPISDVPGLILNEEVKDAKSVAGLLTFLLRVQGNTRSSLLDLNQ